MKTARKIISFLAVLIFVSCVVFLAARSTLMEWVSVAQHGYGLTVYDAVGSNANGVAVAANWSEGGVGLRFFTIDGKSLGHWTVELGEEESEGSIGMIYPVKAGWAFLATYDRNAEHLTIYRVSPEGAERVYRTECTGGTSAERKQETRAFSFSRNGSTIGFVVLSEGVMRAYTCPLEGGAESEEAESGSGLDSLGGVAQTDEAPAPEGLVTAVVLPDGSFAMGGDGWLTLDGEPVAADLSGQRVSHLVCTGPWLYYIDDNTLEVWYTDLTGSGARLLFTLFDLASLGQFSGMDLTADGAILLLNGQNIYFVNETHVADLTAMLYQTPAAAILKLAGTALGILVVSAILWYLVCGIRKGRMPLAVFWGGIVVALSLVSIVALREQALNLRYSDYALNSGQIVVESSVSLALTEEGVTADSLPIRLGQALEGVSDRFHDVTVTVAQKTEDGWRTPQGALAVMDGVFHPDAAEITLEHAGAVDVIDGRLLYALQVDGWTLYLTAGMSTEQDSALVWDVSAAVVILAAAVLLILALVNHDIRRLAKGMERLTAKGHGKEWFNLPTGDELEGMASTLSSLAGSLEEQDRQREILDRSYRRFVPEQVLSLLGKRSIVEVDKNTFASRRMAVMMVAFSFPAPVYSSANSRLLFDSVNQVIERTAAIAAKKGGTVFNFAYNGFDVVMEEKDLKQVVSTAVAIEQEVLALNERRGRQSLPAVALHIALDVGDVMIGVVGDETQMEPTTISSSFSTVRELIGLCGKLEAGILCTETIIAGAEGYGSRYLGKCRLNQTSIRVYEVFDGDPYGVRKGKESTARRFSEGVFLLYSGRPAEAKRIFLELAHDNPGDGGARYYLYIADRMERRPDEPCSLNGG